MDTSVDRTRELEQRLRAIRVQGTDTCIFFLRREGCLLQEKQCAYCTWGEFHSAFPEEQGLCKFKHRGMKKEDAG